MTDTRTRATVRYLGGETGHRSFFGGTHSRTRIALIALFIVAGMILTPLIGWPGMLIGITGCGVTFLATTKTHRGSMIERRIRRTRWKSRVQAGTDAFEPFEVGAWDQAEQKVRDTQTLKGRARRQSRWSAARSLTRFARTPTGQTVWVGCNTAAANQVLPGMHLPVNRPTCQ